jgi:hypothetical protein
MKKKVGRVIQKRHSKPQRHSKPPRQQAIVRREPPTVAEAIEHVLIQGDLSPLSAEQRLQYYSALCKSLGLNPLSRPFAYIYFRETEDAPAKLVLYALKDCTEQLRKKHCVAVLEEKETIDEEFISVSVKVQDKTGRTDTGLGVVPLMGWSRKKQEAYRLKGLALANARMKCSTKAKRRATLSICGLGMLDESEFDTLVRGEDYWEVTPSGRRIVEEAKIDPLLWCKKHNCHISKCPSDEHTSAENDEALKKMQESKLTPEQKQIAERKTSHQGVPALFYVYHPESETYTIDGADALKTANKDLLGPLWDGGVRAIVATPKDLGRLISKFEDRKVPFKELQGA